ncbi:TonB-dependent receptor [Phenylobacterium immobile]|uniref:TonB-dependent receptor n=1 Tax=Phenylobacterium immobile TaxID=21 RepID=UPI0011476E0A|nr:TonB-dependent receptor [Phenylobacterium immobile]
MIDLALQADISLLGAAACRGTSPTLVGRYTIEQALHRLLADANCDWRMPAAGVVQISPLRRAAPEPAPPTTVSEVLITVTKRVEAANRLAASVSTLSRRALAETGSVDPADISGQLSGLLTTDLGPARDKLLLRGLSDGAFTGRSRSTVGTYLDDAPLNYNAPDPDLRLVDVEQVELVRGPQGALYGGGSLSGVFRIVTRKPDLYAYEGEARVTGAYTSKGDPSHAVEAIGNFPLVEGRLGLRIATYEEGQGGYLDDLNLDLKDVDRTTRYGGRVTLAFQANDTWSATLSATGQHLASDDTHYTVRGFGLTRLQNLQEPHDNDFGLVSANLRGAFDWGELAATTAYVQHRYASLYDASRVISDFSDLGNGVGVYTESTRTEMAVQDIVLTSHGAGRFGWLAGAYGALTNESAPNRIFAGQGASQTIAYVDDRRDRIRDLALYGEASLEVLPGWTAALGARAFRTEVRTRSDVWSERGPARGVSRTIRTTGLSPKFTLQRELARGDTLYGVISQGHRAGGVNTGGIDPLTAGREAFSSDRLTNFELGGKFRLLHRRMSLNAALFYDVWTNIQTDQFRDSGLLYVANVGDAAIMGLEAEAGYAVSGLSLSANLLASRTDILRANPEFAQQLAKGLPNAPDISFGLVASYRRDFARSLAWRVTGAASYVGASRVTFDPALSSKMGDYVRLKFAAALSGRGWNAELFVTNPLDQLANTFAFGNPFTFVQVNQSTPQRPLTLGLTLSAFR